ncbi:hypothetical protein QQ045_013359 [Rhodiola kirilowii]
MFADDCLIFLKAKREAAVHVRKLLNDYELVAGHKENFYKSEMVCSKNVSEPLKSEMAEALQVKMVDSHTKYLCLPIIFGHKKKHLFREIEEKISRKLGDWKSKILSRAGREKGPSGRGIHWIKADTLCMEKHLGSMGFRKLHLMNIAMLAKQGWRILTEPSLLVSKVIKAKYIPNGDLFNAEMGARPSYGWR